MKLLWIICVFIGGLLLTACKSSQPVFERSRSEYEYVPPMLRPTPMPTPAPVMEPEEPEMSAPEAETAPEPEEAKEKEKPSFFGRIFGRNRSDDVPTISRVGDGAAAVNVEGDVPQAEPDQPTENVYRLRVGDSLFVTLSGSAGLNEQIETKIDADGNIKLRFIGTVKAKDLSTTELEREIKAEYTERQKIYRDITVRVVVPNTFYFIGGEVRQPGRFPMMGRVTLSQAVVAAGNFTEWANNRRIVLVRNNERAVINFREIMRDPTRDVELLAGDVITVERSTF
ncbi:MAG: polysaccharide biosynthesis/export family protein [Kiritimatiellia bacterium]